MDPIYEVASLINDWLTIHAPEWRIDYGDSDDSKPTIVRTRHHNPVAHIINEDEVVTDYRYVALRGDVRLRIADPKFFMKLKKVLKDCEETFNY